MKESQMIGKFVVVRQRDAGVHCGVLVEFSDHCLRLENARTVWRWRGAMTLYEMSQTGVESPSEGWTRISVPCSSVYILGACEVLQCTDVARASLEDSGWPE